MKLRLETTGWKELVRFALSWQPDVQVYLPKRLGDRVRWKKEVALSEEPGLWIMLRIVMDTNALVAARWKREGAAARLMDLCVQGTCRALVTPDVILENLHILRKVRPSAAFWEKIHRFHGAAKLVTDLPDVHVHEDPSDSVFLACALGGEADYLVSTDRHLRAHDGQDGLTIGPASRVFGDHPGLERLTSRLPGSGRLLAELPDAAPDEVTEVLARSPNLRIERIVSHGQASPPGFWFDQAEHEWVAVIRGQAGLLIEGEDGERVLGPGDFVFLPAHVRHRVEWTAEDEETVWLAVFWGSYEGRSISSPQCSQ